MHTFNSCDIHKLYIFLRLTYKYVSEHISVSQFSCSVMSDSLRPHEPQHASPPCPSPAPGSPPKPMSIESVCHPTISSVVPFSCSQSFPASGSLPKSRLFASGGQNIGASASILPMNNQDWFPLELTGWISLQSKGLSRVFSSATVWKHQFFSTQPSLWFNSHVRTWLGKNHSFDYMDLCWQSDMNFRRTQFGP